MRRESEAVPFRRPGTGRPPSGTLSGFLSKAQESPFSLTGRSQDPKTGIWDCFYNLMVCLSGRDRTHRQRQGCADPVLSPAEVPVHSPLPALPPKCRTLSGNGAEGRPQQCRHWPTRCYLRVNATGTLNVLQHLH